MATRSGSVDPGLLLWLLERTELDEQQMARALEHESGMLALAGTADMRAVIEAAANGDTDASLALDVYLHRLRAGIAAMAAAMDGLDVIVWTGGVGEHAPMIRAGATDGLGFLGLQIDHELNQSVAEDCDVTRAPSSCARVRISRSRGRFVKSWRDGQATQGPRYLWAFPDG
jgi:acetate kinase